MEFIKLFCALSRAIKINLTISCDYDDLSDLINKSFQYFYMEYWLLLYEQYRCLLVLKDYNSLFLFWSVCKLAVRLGAIL